MVRGPVFLRTGSNPSLTPPPRAATLRGLPPGSLARPPPPLGSGRRARARDSSIPQAVRAAGGGGARGEGGGARGEGAGRRRGRGAGAWGRGRGRAGVGSSSLADHTLCGPIPSQPLAVSHAGHVQAFAGTAGEGEGARRREGS